MFDTELPGEVGVKYESEPSGLPSAADLDAVAEEEKAKEATGAVDATAGKVPSEFGEPADQQAKVEDGGRVAPEPGDGTQAEGQQGDASSAT